VSAALRRAGLAGRPAETTNPLHARALLVVHHLGIPQDVVGWRTWCDERGLLLIEDATRAWTAVAGGAPVGGHGDLAVLSPKDTHGVAGTVLLVHARLALRTVPRAGPADALRRALLARVGADDSAAVRRANHRLLAEALGTPAADVPDGAAPYVLAVPADATLERRLAAGRIEVLRDAGDGLVGLPVHQRLGLAELDRIAACVTGTPRSPAPRIRTERIASLDAFRDPWSALADRCGSPFDTWEWAATWWRHFGPGHDLETLAVYDGDRLAGILPLCATTRGGARLLRFLGHGPGDWLGPICADADVPLVARALDTALHDGTIRWDALLGERLRTGRAWRPLLHGRVLQRESSPVIDLRDGFDGWLATRSRNFREQARRRGRRLARAHDVHFRRTEDAERVDADLGTLIALHEARWQSASRAFAGARRAFHLELARTAVETGRVRLWTLELDGRPAAAWYGFRHAGAEWYYQAGRDPALDREGVGFVLLVHTIRAAAEEGAATYHLLRGGEEYKGRFTDDEIGLETAVLGHGALGALAAAVAPAAAALPPEPRRRLLGLAG
jgi:CelD/BcsL family acetyltransferase involved in cellulose biosynthesis